MPVKTTKSSNGRQSRAADSQAVRQMLGELRSALANIQVVRSCPEPAGASLRDFSSWLQTRHCKLCKAPIPCHREVYCSARCRRGFYGGLHTEPPVLEPIPPVAGVLFRTAATVPFEGGHADERRRLLCCVAGYLDAGTQPSVRGLAWRMKFVGRWRRARVEKRLRELERDQLLTVREDRYELHLDGAAR